MKTHNISSAIAKLLFLFLIVSCAAKSQLAVRKSPGERHPESSYVQFADPAAIDTSSLPKVGRFEMVYVNSHTEQMRSNEELKQKAMKLGGNTICITSTKRNAFNGSVRIGGNIYKADPDTAKYTRLYRLGDGPVGKLSEIKMKKNGEECLLSSNTYIDIKNSEFKTAGFELNHRIIQLSILPADQNNYIYVYKNTGSTTQGNIFGVFIDGIALDENTELDFWSMGQSMKSCFDN